MIIKTEPYKLEGFLNNPKYVCAYCTCPVDISNGIVINKDDIRKYQPESFERGYIEAECVKCGAHMQGEH